MVKVTCRKAVKITPPKIVWSWHAKCPQCSQIIDIQLGRKTFVHCGKRYGLKEESAKEAKKETKEIKKEAKKETKKIKKEMKENKKVIEKKERVDLFLNWLNFEKVTEEMVKQFKIQNGVEESDKMTPVRGWSVTRDNEIINYFITNKEQCFLKKID